uniref:Uncharacterized protein n=1 Tax=Plectus sambesii TaxID=2011161 RepID=A0A914XCH8_9BILA
MLYCTGDNNKTTAGTGFRILASLAFIRLYTLNYTDNDGTGNDGTGNDGTTGNDDFHQTTHHCEKYQNFLPHRRPLIIFVGAALPARDKCQVKLKRRTELIVGYPPTVIATQNSVLLGDRLAVHDYAKQYYLLTRLDER